MATECCAHCVCSDRQFHIVGLNSLAFSAGVYGCDTAYLVPPLTETDAYLQALLEIVENKRPDIIIPGRDAELPVLAQARDELQQHGAFLMVGSEAAVKICTDKYLAGQQLRAAGLPFAPTARSRTEISALVEQYGFPLLVKPAAGCASRDVCVAWCWDDLETLGTKDGNWIVQKYLVPVEWGCSRQDIRPDLVHVDGHLRQDSEYSVQILIGHDEILGIFASCNTLLHGMPMAIKVVHDTQLEEQALAIAHLLQKQGLFGPCNLQAKNDVDEGYTFFEINARFTGITPVRARMGFNEVLAAYQYFVCEESPVSNLRFDREQLAYRYLSESVFSAKDLQQLRTEKKWPTSSQPALPNICMCRLRPGNVFTSLQ